VEGREMKNWFWFWKKNTDGRSKKMIAGRELDQLVAEKCLGLKVKVDESGNRLVEVVRRVEPNTLNVEVINLPHYSTEGESAIEVLNMLERSVGCVGMSYTNVGKSWCISIDKAKKYQETYRASIRVEAPTFAHAVCLAAVEVGRLREEHEWKYLNQRE
jgi:hypothetical protein